MLGQSAQTAMPMQMKSRVVNMRMPNVVWLMSFLRGEVDACDPDYNTNHKGESGKQPASAEENTYEGGSDSSRTDLAQVICYSSAFFGCHGGPLIARPSPCQVRCLARGEVGKVRLLRLELSDRPAGPYAALELYAWLACAAGADAWSVVPVWCLHPTTGSDQRRGARAWECGKVHPNRFGWGSCLRVEQNEAELGQVKLAVLWRAGTLE